jgi:succinate dehydrogenase / fumarate reductase membrane anchor subunit
MASSKSNAINWFLHRITGTFLVFMLITHFWVQHYDTQVASISKTVVTQEQPVPKYPEEAQQAAAARFSPDEVPEGYFTEDGEVTPYGVVMQRLADPVYAVLWKGFNILFLVVALHHGFYGLNNVLTDYIRNPMGRVAARVLSWSTALVLLIIGLYSVVTAGW